MGEDNKLKVIFSGKINSVGYERKEEMEYCFVKLLLKCDTVCIDGNTVSIKNKVFQVDNYGEYSLRIEY